MSEAWRIAIDDLSGPAIRALLSQHFESMLANSPVGSCHFLDFDGLNAPDVTFWSIHSGDALAGCGALKMLDDAHGEIKSMRTADDFRRQGVAAKMLSHVMAVARDRGLKRLSLETGTGPAFEAATALYRQFGFVDCPPFGDYRIDPFSLFMTRRL